MPSSVHQVEQLRDSDRWTAFLDFAQAFHAYSINNLLLILGQREDASRDAGFRKWQSLNRQVRKGEKGIRIFGYSTKKVTEEDENGDEVEKRIARFPILSVFDIGQTELIEPEQGDPGTSRPSSPAPTTTASWTPSAPTSKRKAGPLSARAFPAP